MHGGTGAPALAACRSSSGSTATMSPPADCRPIPAESPARGGRRCRAWWTADAYSLSFFPPEPARQLRREFSTATSRARPAAQRVIDFMCQEASSRPKAHAETHFSLADGTKSTRLSPNLEPVVGLAVPIAAYG